MQSENQEQQQVQNTAVATFAGGCFWCVEACFKKVKGVLTCTSGYCGGAKENPTYYEVKSGSTGHAEVTQIFLNKIKGCKNRVQLGRN
jgi:peptide methionine sulfoxide reductase MsrA